MKAGIVSYGAYVPRYRITPAEIGRVWGTDGASTGESLGVRRKSVPAPDEDTITISTEALRTALIRGAIDPQQIGALYVGSESHPYAVKPTATVVAQAVGATPNLTAADFEFACKAGTAAIQTCLGLVGADMIRYGVAIGTDTSQGAPGDALEYSASAGGAAFVVGRERIICRVARTVSYTTDTPISGDAKDSDIRATAGVSRGARVLPARHRVRPQHDAERGVRPRRTTAHVVFHQPNGKFPPARRKAARIHRGADALRPRHALHRQHLLAARRSSGSRTSSITRSPGERILMVGYGSGAGSDAFDLETTDELATFDRSSAGPSSGTSTTGSRSRTRSTRSSAARSTWEEN